METFSSRPPLLSDPENLQLFTESLRAHGHGRIHLKGKSMLPTLREGWTMHVRALPAEDLQVGDIGIFVYRGIITIHRLIWKIGKAGQNRFLFQGDNSAEREWVEAGAILGRVDAYEEESSGGRGAGAVRLGGDALAFFYRNTHRLHALVVRMAPGAALPVDGGKGSLLYRCLRTLFRRLKPVFTPPAER